MSLIKTLKEKGYNTIEIHDFMLEHGLNTLNIYKIVPFNHINQRISDEYHKKIKKKKHSEYRDRYKSAELKAQTLKTKK